MLTDFIPPIILVRGGGDLATGVSLRLFRCDFQLVITELDQPLSIRRSVSFSEAVYTGEKSVEGVTARRVMDLINKTSILAVLAKHEIPVIVDPDCNSATILKPLVIIDARMTKFPPKPIRYHPKLYIGMGPGFTIGEDCHSAVETRRGHYLGRVLNYGSTAIDTRVPEDNPKRVVRSPAEGLFIERAEIGAHVECGQLIAEINPDIPVSAGSSFIPVLSPMKGILRGLIHSGIRVNQGQKIGDVDPRDDPIYCRYVSDKSLAVAGGVLEAILSFPGIRHYLWE